MYHLKSIEKALSIATAAHEGQVDKGGKPYIEHPIYVASLVNSESEKIVALLHDVIEDTDITLKDLYHQGFSKHILIAVDAITKRSNEGYTEYLERLCQNSIAISVKIADMTHNSDISRISNPTVKDYDRVKKYQEKIEFLKAFKQ